MVVVRGVNSCGAGAPDTFYIAPAVVPTATFTVAQHVTYVHLNDTLTYTGTAPTGSSYTWDFGGGTAVPGTGVGPHAASWSVGGLKTVSLTVSNAGCSSTYTDTVHVIDNTGIRELSLFGAEVSLTPNPNDGTFEIVLSKALAIPASVRITDMAGKTVYANELPAGNMRLPVTVPGIAAGNYAVMIAAGGATTTGKLTITGN